MADTILDPSLHHGTKEYHSRKSKEWYHRTKNDNPEILKARNLYVTIRRLQNKAACVQQFGGVCAHCKVAYPDCVFEFHHRNSEEKEYSPSHLFHLSQKTIQAELAKCIMLCANCHRMEHDRLKYADHAKRAFHGKMDREIKAKEAEMQAGRM